MVHVFSYKIYSFIEREIKWNNGVDYKIISDLLITHIRFSFNIVNDLIDNISLETYAFYTYHIFFFFLFFSNRFLAFIEKRNGKYSANYKILSDYSKDIVAITKGYQNTFFYVRSTTYVYEAII